MPPARGSSTLPLGVAAELTRTGDLWLFRGSSPVDRAIRTATNAPVNHVGMALVLDDLPPLLWHAELGRSLPSAWSGERRSGVQLHDLHDAVVHWRERYGQSAWLRQLEPPADRAAEDAALRVVARFDGRPFPTTRALVSGWVLSRARRSAEREAVFCAELVAATYAEMGLLPADRPAAWYDPGRFWSGDDLRLLGGARLGAEVAVR